MLKPMLLTALSAFLLNAGVISAAEYGIKLLAPIGKELFTSSAGREVKINDNGYASGLVHVNKRTAPFIYHVNENKFKLVDVESDSVMMGENGTLVGSRLSYDGSYFSRGIFTYNFELDQVVDMGSPPPPYDSYSPHLAKHLGIAGITNDEKVYLYLKSDFGFYEGNYMGRCSFIYDCRTGKFEKNAEDYIYRVNANGDYLYIPLNLPTDDYDEQHTTWVFHHATQARTKIDEVQDILLAANGAVVGVSAWTNHSSFHEIKFLSTEKGLKKIETLGGWALSPKAVNKDGLVVGSSQIEPHMTTYHAFLFDDDSGMLDLAANQKYYSEALDINDQGQVVGRYNISYYADDPSVGFIWEAEYGLRDLNKLIPANSGWKILSAHSINNEGYIVGEGLYFGVKNYFLLKPQP